MRNAVSPLREPLGLRQKNCHNSPTLDEAPLQQAILAALNTSMTDKSRRNTDTSPFSMSLGNIERRLEELEQQFQTLLEKAVDDPTAYGSRFKEILDEQTLLKKRRSDILADDNRQKVADQRIAPIPESASPRFVQWDETVIRQLVETVRVLSKDEVAVILKSGIEIRQRICK